jgi:predicted phage terminase large subunit-like protein
VTALQYLPATKRAEKIERVRLLNSIKPRLVEPYTKHIPHPTQQLFLLQHGEEVMYGGAAGGGKSDALLMAALQYVDVPGYSALLLRRTWPDLSLPGAILDRAREWFSGTDAQKKEGGRIWVFPSGARITFGYLHRENDKYRYQSAEFQYVGFDELTQFSQSMYEYLFSRIRRPNLVCLRCRKPVRRYRNHAGQPQWKHTSSSNPCNDLVPDPKVLHQYPASKDGLTLFDVPLRMRSATNPGGTGHTWVREHFVDPVRKSPNAVFIPATLADNPSLDQETYRKNLEHLGPVDRERLMNGDWDVSEEGAYFQRHWFTFLREPPPGHRVKWLRYWDMAATKDGDWTVGCLMGLTDEGTWVIRDIRRMRGTPHEVERFIQATAMEDGAGVPIRMEQEPGSSGVMAIDYYRRKILVGYDFRADKKTGSKETLAKPVSSAAEAGNVALVVGEWNRDFLDEVSLFPNGAHDDQIDAMSGAFHGLTGRRARLLV